MVERQLSTSDPIPIKKVAMESSSDKISVSGSECQGKTNLSRSFEESRPRLPQSLKKSNHHAAISNNGITNYFYLKILTPLAPY